MNKYTLSVLYIGCLLLSGLSLCGQRICLEDRVLPYKAITFDSLNPIWHEPYYDAVYADSCDGYNSFFRPFNDKIMHVDSENNLYEVLWRIGVNNTLGSYILKRNLTTGQLLWQVYIGLPELTYQEFVRSLEVDEASGQLKVITLIHTAPLDITQSGLVYEPVFPTIRYYDAADGTLLRHESPDPTLYDKVCLTKHSIWYNYNDFQLIGDSIHMFEIKMKSDFFHLDSSYYISTFLTPTTQCDAAPTYDRWLGTKKYIVFDGLIRLGKDTLLIVEASRNDNPIKKIYLTYTDLRFNVLEEYETEAMDIPWYHFAKIKAYDRKTGDIYIENLSVNNSFTDRRMDLRVVGRTGEHKHTHYIGNVGSVGILDYTDPAKVKLMTTNFFGDLDYFDISETDGKNGVKLIKTFEASDTMYTISVNSILHTDEDHVWVGWTEGRDYIDDTGVLRSDYSARVLRSLCLSKAELGIKASSIQEIDADIPMTIAPNPTEGRLVGMFSEPFTGVWALHDMSGRCYLRGEIQNAYTLEQDISSLSRGVYILHVRSHNPQHRPTTYKVLKH